MLKKENHTKILFGGPLGVYRSTRIEINLLSGTVLIGVSVDRMNGGYWQYTVSPGETTIGKILSDIKELYLPELPEEACADPTVLHIGKPGKVTVNPELATQAVKNLKPETQGDEQAKICSARSDGLKLVQLSIITFGNSLLTPQREVAGRNYRKIPKKYLRSAPVGH